MLKPSQASVSQPFLHLIGNHRRRAEHRRPAIAAEPLRELPHGQVLPLCQGDGAFATAFARIGFGDFRQRRIGIEA